MIKIKVRENIRKDHIENDHFEKYVTQKTISSKKAHFEKQATSKSIISALVSIFQETPFWKRRIIEVTLYQSDLFWLFAKFTLTIRVIISLVLIPSVLSVAMNMPRLFGKAYESRFFLLFLDNFKKITILATNVIRSFVVSNEINFVLIKKFN